MKKRLLRIITLCIALCMMTGCSYRDFEDDMKEKKAQKEAEADREAYYENVEPVQTSEETENTESDEELPLPPEYVEIKTGPNEIAEDRRGEVNYTIDNVRFYEHFSENDYGITAADFVDSTNEDFGEYGFLLMDVTIENISNVGSVPSSEIPYINISMITLQPREPLDTHEAGFNGTYPNYFDKGVDDEHNGYCIAIEQGTTDKFMLGFLVPTNTREELTEYVLDYNNCQRYEIPRLSN